MAHQVVWVDIPVIDLDRAIKFYSAVLGKTVTRDDHPNMSIGVLPHEGDEVGGCLVCHPERPPGMQGPMIYLNAAGRLEAAEAAVKPNGGMVLESRHPIGPYGFRTVILDSEGNRVALHST